MASKARSWEAHQVFELEIEAPALRVQTEVASPWFLARYFGKGAVAVAQTPQRAGLLVWVNDAEQGGSGRVEFSVESVGPTACRLTVTHEASVFAAATNHSARAARAV